MAAFCELIANAKAALVVFTVAALVGTLSGQDFKVTLLGTGNPRPVMSRFGPSILVEAGKEKLVFDCGRGATQRLYQLKIPFTEITGLFLTHLHSDHTVGIPDLWLTGWVCSAPP
ncbi:MAG: MBL fold metallo-hydrolase [Terriglobales bacterium]